MDTTLNRERPTLGPSQQFDWVKVAKTLLLSRSLDRYEEQKLLPEGAIAYQFSAGGHELGQIILGTHLGFSHDAISGYYRSRPLLLTLGLRPLDIFLNALGKSGTSTGGRDAGVLFNDPNPCGRKVLPMSGGVGSQYSVAAGWAHSIVYQHQVLGKQKCKGSLAVALGGDGSIASNGFWAALNTACTRQLPVLFFIEDNGYALSVPGTLQTPGGNIAANLKCFANLRVHDSDTRDLLTTSSMINDAVEHVRSGAGPALVRVVMPRLVGHSAQDAQEYKTRRERLEERLRDPLLNLKSYVLTNCITEQEWATMERTVDTEVQTAWEQAQSVPEVSPSRADVCRYMFDAPSVNRCSPEALTSSNPISMVRSIRQTLETELRSNPKLLLFGQDIGAKGGVYGATSGLQRYFGRSRVFDTSLSEEGIVGNAVGCALAGLRPVVEIQFRKYAESASEQLSDCGTLRWRTMNRFSAPIVVRMAGGHSSRCGDPWHSVSGEVTFARSMGWQLIYPSNAQDASGLLRSAMHSQNPSIFFEHRALLFADVASRAYPGDLFTVPLGLAAIVRSGRELTLVTWGAMVYTCLEAIELSSRSVELIDLRTIMPWDIASVVASVRRTHRCLIVHEDTLTCGFGAEIAAVIGHECFLNLDAPIARIAVPDIPLPYKKAMLTVVLPSPVDIAEQIQATLRF